MTRIVAGTWGGRRLQVPRNATIRPTAERVREAWLSMLAPELPGARVLDLFAGTGALGLEALSRGAAAVTFVERHAPTLAVIRANASTLDALDRVHLVRGDALRYAAGLTGDEVDLVLADPPFDSDAAAQLAQQWHRAPFARLLAVEHSPRVILPDADTTRRWGDIAVSFYRRP